MWKKIFSGMQKNDDASDKSYLDELVQDQLPQHVAIIMDGNGRWATGQGLIRTAGHKAGVKTLKRIVKTCTALGMNALTVYAFSNILIYINKPKYKQNIINAIISISLLYFSFPLLLCIH